MPRYDYDCGTCGPFTQMCPVAAYLDPQPCPTCGTASPRHLLTTPMMKTSAPERGPGLRYQGRTHAASCGCCAPAARRGA